MALMHYESVEQPNSALVALHFGKFLDTLEAQRNCAPSSHIHSGLHLEFNK